MLMSESLERAAARLEQISDDPICAAAAHLLYTLSKRIPECPAPVQVAALELAMVVIASDTPVNMEEH